MKHWLGVVILAGAIMGAAFALPTWASDLQEADIEFFEKQIRPLLVQGCYECHSQEAGDGQGGLFLDSPAGWRQGGDSGPPIVAGDPEASLLIQAVRYDDPYLQMPPEGKLPPEQVDALVEWVRRGAPDPRAGEDPPQTPQTYTVDVEAGRRFWAFQPPSRSEPPPVRDSGWPRSDIDRFILARLENHDLRPASDAERRTLLRRAYFDLVGLPPTPTEIEAFLEDPSPDAFAGVVDQLLASPRFGERWGRHWLDVARYAESTGERGRLYQHAWRYRDYVIQSFNEDKPYDRFVTEQIAGDLLPHDSPQQRREQLTATAFLALGPHNFELQDKPRLTMDVVDEQIGAVGRGLLGLTLDCARCHDHKTDPIPTKDYYALAGIFRSTQSIAHSNVSNWIEQDLPLDDEQEQALRAHNQSVRQLEQRLEKLGNSESEGDGESAGTGRSDAKAEMERLEAELKQLQQNAPKRPRAIVVREQAAGQIGDQHVLIRGNVRQPGELAPRGFVSVASYGPAPQIEPQESGRLQLAQWLTSHENPLTARVMVNRVWRHLFGAGLVRSTENFGQTGEPPSHPELLDYLALEFMEQGWSIKTLIRQIMLSRVYQLAADAGPEAAARDPDNRLLARMNRRRLEAEPIRDAMLAVSSELDYTALGPTTPENLRSEYGYQVRTLRRAVYVPVFRIELYDFFDIFDFPDPNRVSGGRHTTTLATQALYMMNHPFIMDRSLAAARHLLSEPELDDPQRVDLLYKRALGRGPTQQERELALEYLAQSAAEPGQADAQQRLPAWADICQALFASIDFRYLD